VIANGFSLRLQLKQCRTREKSMIAYRSVDSRDSLIGLDAGRAAWCDARMYVLTSGLVYGSGVFEVEDVNVGASSNSTDKG
jgi:hypothetical protein